MDLCNKSKKMKYGVTHVDAKEFVYVWLIKNFKFYNFGTEKVLSSQKFTTGEKDEHTWQIEIDDNHEYFGLCLSLHSGGPEVDAFLVLSICDQYGVDKVIKQSSFLIKYLNNAARRFSEFIKKDFLFDEKNKLLVNDTLTVKCKLYYTSVVAINCEGEQNDLYMNNVVTHDWEYLLNDTKLSDVKIIVGQEEFQAHKCILAARSSIFSAMFEHDMLEKNENVIRIEDIEPKVMKAILRFMYCGKIDSKVSIYDLYVAANKYDLEELQNICENKLIDALSIENIGETLIFADVYKAEKLKKHVLKFITNHTKDINFENFKIDVEPHSPLLVDLIRQLISN